MKQNQKLKMRTKMKNKNLDAIVLNSLKDKGAGFGYNTNKVTIITPLEEMKFDLKTKDLVAKDILNFVKNVFKLICLVCFIGFSKSFYTSL